MAAPPSLSIIVVSYNTHVLLRKCLSTVYENNEKVRLEIIVVDNASADGSAAMVQQEFPQVALVQNRLNLGFAKAANQGLRIARGEFLLLLNSDAEARPFAFRHCIEFLRAHRDAGIVGCKLLNPDGSLQSSCESFLDFPGIVFESLFLEKLFPRSQLFGRLHLTYFGYDHVAEVDYVMGAFLMIRRQAFAEIGLLDENFFFYAEEMDWCYRAKRKGWRVYFTPGAEVIHHGGQSSDPISPRMFVQLHKSRFQFYRKHHGALTSAAVRGVSAFGALLRIFVWSVVALYRRLFRPEQAQAARKKVAAFYAAFLWYIGWKAVSEKN